MINQQEIQQLLRPTAASPKLSILIPTYRYGHQVKKGHDALNLKTSLKEARKYLQMEGWDEGKIRKFLRPARNLLDDDHFWNQQSDGLAIYLSDDIQQIHTLPVHFENMVYLGDEFYLKPISSLIGSESRFFILCLSQNELAFFEATAHSITSVKIDDLVPMGIAEMDEKVPEKVLQMHSHSVSTGFPSHYHGHGGRNDNHEVMVEKYLRAIDKGLMTMLFDEKPPLLVVSVDELYAQYKQINSYAGLQESHISGNPFPVDMGQLQERAWTQMKPYFEQERKAYVDTYYSMVHRDLTTTSIDVIMRAAKRGRVQCLFTRDDRNLWGNYDPNSGHVQVHPMRSSDSNCLLNEATIAAFNHGGKTFNLPASQMPGQTKSPVAAILRY